MSGTGSHSLHYFEKPSPKLLANLPNLPEIDISGINNNKSEISFFSDNEDDQHHDDSLGNDFVEFDLGHSSSRVGIMSSDDLIQSSNNISGVIRNSRNNNSVLSVNGRSRSTSPVKDQAIAAFKNEKLMDHPIEKNEPLPKPFLQNEGENANGGEDEDDDEIFDDNDSWQEMQTDAKEDIYNDKGEVLFKLDSSDKDDSRPIDGSKAGYTRINAEEQAELYKKLNKKTDFLFDKQDNGKESAEFDEEIINDFNKDSYSPLNQLKTTKIMLKDVEKFAYVGLVKLVMNEMATDLAKIAMILPPKSKSKYTKRINIAQASFAHWQLKIMARLYSHLEFNESETQMIDNLVKHGIDSKDLSKSLNKSEVIDNPVFDQEASSSTNNSKSEEIFKTDEDSKKIIDANEITNSKKIEIDVKWTVICDLFLVLVADSIFDSRARTLLLKFAKYIGLSSVEICQFERRITDAFQLEEGSEQVWDEKTLLDKRKKAARKKRLMYVGLATIGGSLVLGLSAGLLGPVIGAGIAAGLTTVGISGTSGFLAGAGGTALVAVTGTAIGGKIGLQGMMKRVGDVKTFEFIPLYNNKRVNLIITVSGWINSKADDIRLPFSTIDPVMGDLFSVLWEPEILQSTGESVSIIASEVITQSIQQILGATILIAFMSAVQIPMVISKLSYILDNPWSVSLDRAWKAGLVLADTLIERNLGARPITLVGFSLGSRVIYSCLLELAKRGAYGLVEKVILFGSPFLISLEDLVLAKSVCSGQFVNGYSKKDWILGYLYRATSGGLGRVAGLSPIQGIDGIDNFDCTEYVKGHMEYRKEMPKLLKLLDFQVLSEEFIEIDEPDPESTERTRKLISEFDEAAKNFQKDQGNNKKGIWNKLFKSKKNNWWQYYTNNSGSNEKIDEIFNKVKNEEFNVDNIMEAVDQLKEMEKHKDGHELGGSEADLSEAGHSVEETSEVVSEITSLQNEENAEVGKDLAHDDQDLGKEDATENVDEHAGKDVGEHAGNVGEDEQENKKISLLDDDDEFKPSEKITMTFA